jgi:hypothetical protein
MLDELLSLGGVEGDKVQSILQSMVFAC